MSTNGAAADRLDAAALTAPMMDKAAWPMPAVSMMLPTTFSISCPRLGGAIKERCMAVGGSLQFIINSIYYRALFVNCLC